ncbi:reverse transcriptase domain-containing protein [Tanacetum coccineum]
MARYKMVFVPFTAIDNHRRSVTVGSGLLKKETAEAYGWLLRAFKKAFVRPPNIVVTDQDGAMRLAVAAEFPESKHRLCMWHIMQKIPAKDCFRISSNDHSSKVTDCGSTTITSNSSKVFSWDGITKGSKNFSKVIWSDGFSTVYLAQLSGVLTAVKIQSSCTDRLALVDYLSKWVEAKALPTNDARVVVKFLKSCFTQFGSPRAIISDRGTRFCNDKFAKVMSKYRVTRRLATAYHPQTSGQVKVSNRGLKRILERMVSENRASWSDKLDDALWALCAAFKTPIGCTPYKLVYKKSCHLPIELEHKAYWALKHANFDLKTVGDHRKLQLNKLNELRDQAYEYSLIYKERTKKLHDSKIKNCIFNVGDRVLLFNSRLKIFSRKLKTRWSGPFTIT